MHKVLKVDDFESKKEKIKEFLRQFEEEYGKKLLILSTKNQKEVELKEYFFVFENLEEVIYAYVSLDLITRAVFVKDS